MGYFFLMTKLKIYLNILISKNWIKCGYYDIIWNSSQKDKEKKF